MNSAYGKETNVCKLNRFKSVFHLSASCTFKCNEQQFRNETKFVRLGFRSYHRDALLDRNRLINLRPNLNQSTFEFHRYQELLRFQNMNICGSIPFDLNVELCLTQAESTGESGAESKRKSDAKGKETLSYRYQQLSAVFCSVNGCKKETMKKSPHSYEWSVNLTSRPIPATKLSLQCVFWIKFEDFFAGEMILIKHLTEMYVQQNHCDVKFTFEGNESIGGHEHILAARSPVFAAMFQHDMQEAKTGQVAIHDVQLDIFKEMLYYIYSGRIRIKLTEETAMAMYMVADKYDIDDLKKVCRHFLSDFIDVKVDNALDLLVWAHLHSVNELKEKILVFIALHAAEICQLDDWETIEKNYPDLCLLAARRMIVPKILNVFPYVLMLSETK